jgi:hypothetical protein
MEIKAPSHLSDLVAINVFPGSSEQLKVRSLKSHGACEMGRLGGTNGTNGSDIPGDRTR